MSGTKTRISKVTQSSNLNYFNLWWHRMGVESRKEEKELKRKEEEVRRADRKRKFSTKMGWTKKEATRARITLVDIPEDTNLQVNILNNIVGEKDEQIPGVIIEGVRGETVPAFNAIIERSQAANIKTQYLDGTETFGNRHVPGSPTAKVESDELMRVSESSFSPAL